MAVRIRYGRPQEGVITSKQFYVNEAGKRFNVQINTTDFHYIVLEDVTSKVAGEGRAVNLHQAKIKAKQKLEDLGIKFEAEARTFDSKLNPDGN